MREWWGTFRKNPKAWLAAVLGALVIWALFEVRTGFLEGSGWGPRQWGARLGKWARGPDDAREKPKLETGSIPQTPAKPEVTDAQKKEMAARARRARCEREKGADLIEAEKNLAIHGYVVSACIAEAKQSIFTAGNPERACKAQIDAKGASEERRNAVSGRKC